MKTPRDWLLDRHRVAAPQLDGIRRSALPTRHSCRELWRDLFLPHRIAWRAIAAAWAVLALFHFTLGRSPQLTDASAPPPGLLAALFAQNNFHDTLAENDRLP